MDRDIRKIYETMKDLFRNTLKLHEEMLENLPEGDVSLAEMHAMCAIGTGRPRTMTHVANILEINVSTLTTTIGKLVRKGYVERLRDDKDRRIVRVALTDKGVKAVRFDEDFIEKLVGDAVRHLPHEKIGEYISAIDDIRKELAAKASEMYVRTDPFKMRPLKIGRHELPVPIVQAGMSIRIAGPVLASAVASEGGLGLIGTVDIGCACEGYEKDPAGTNERVIRETVAETVKRAGENGGKGLVGAAVMWGRCDAGRYVRAAVKGGAQVIVTGGSLPTDLPRYCADKSVALIPTVSSKRAASAIIRTWSQRYNRIPDAFILQGPFAAGLLGFREEQIDRAEDEWYRMISEVSSELSRYENCPLIVGGGIFSKEDAAAAYRHGADGFLMGTRFVTTEECDAPEDYKRLYLNCGKNDVTIIRSPLKTSVRAMKNSFTDRISSQETVDYDIFEAVRRSVEGDHDNGLIFCSAEAYRASSIVSVSDVFRQFTT